MSERPKRTTRQTQPPAQQPAPPTPPVPAPPPWQPSAREQRIVYWLQVLTRYVIGGGGLLWCLTVNHLQNSLALVIFGALATSTDVLYFARTLIKEAHDPTHPPSAPLPPHRPRH